MTVPSFPAKPFRCLLFVTAIETLYPELLNWRRGSRQVWESRDPILSYTISGWSKLLNQVAGMIEQIKKELRPSLRFCIE